MWTSRIGARALALSATLVASSAGAQVIPGSCWGNCGERDSLSGCSCDSYCQTRGDCCPDKNTLCYGQFAYPMCPLVKFNTNKAVWGTDLGFSYEHKGKNEMLFGDTWSTDSHPTCATPTKTQWPSDDAMATLLLDRGSLPTSNPTGAVTCPAPTFRTTDIDSFNPVTVSVSGTTLPMGANVTPAAGWSDGNTAFLWVASGKKLPCFWGFCSNGQVCDGDGAYCTDPTSPIPEKHLYSVEVAYRPNEGNPTAYLSGATFYTNRFFFATMVTVAAFNQDVPASNDYRHGYKTLLTFGRPAAYDLSGKAQMFLAYQDLASLVPNANKQINWAPKYFNGLDTSGKPTWTSNEVEADPIITTDVNLTGFTEVAWIEPLRKWVMLYSGDLNLLDNQGRLIAALADGSQARKGAIHMRMADQPWGPWTPPVPLLFRELAASYMGCDAPNTTYGTGPWTLDNDGLYGALWRGSCVSNYQSCGPANPSTPLAFDGTFYAPNIIESWTYPAGDSTYPRAAQIYFNVSTGNPYQVILATARLELPPEGPVTYKRWMHLRAYDGQLVTVGANGADAIVSRQPAKFTTHMQILYKPNTLASGSVTDGNHVLIRADNGKYLRRRGNTLVFESAIVGDSEWIVERLAGAGAVQPDTDVIRLLSATEPRHIKLKTEGLRAYDGGGETANFTLTWGCKVEFDDCR